jgi:hypothetical protein
MANWKDKVRAQAGNRAEQGTFHVNNTVEKTVNFVGFRVDSDAVISLLEIEAVDKLATYIADATTALPASTIVKVNPNESPFTSIQLTSGSVTLILE